MHACLPVPFKHAKLYQSVQGKWTCTKALKGKRNEGGLHNRGSTITPKICEMVRLQQGCPIKTTRYNLLPSKQCIFKIEIIKLL